MEFVTIHDLSRQFNIPSRVVRYRLQKLIVEGKLKDGDDFQREDFKDEQHFVWKINPLSFMRETGLQRVAPPPKISIPVNEVGNNPTVIGNESVNRPAKTVNDSGNQNHNAGFSAPLFASPSVNNPAPVVNHLPQSDNKLVNKTDDETAARAEDRAFEREMIDFMKEQIKIKDELIREQGKFLKDEKDLNQKLNSALLQQGQKIETLLRLTGGKMDVSDTATGTSMRTTPNEMKQAA
jgi:hypothetical protein